MKHLNDAEFVGLLDGDLSDARARHAQDCADCRMRAAAMRTTLAGVMIDAVPPEPSPLFWEHLAARVAEAVQDEEPGSATLSPVAWVRSPALTWVLAASIALLMMVFVAWRATLHAPSPGLRTPPIARVAPDTVAPPPDGATAANFAGDGAAAAGDELESDEAWAVVRTAAEGFAWDDAHEAGISVHPGSAERVALELSGDERIELARLLEGALKRSGV